MSDDRSTKKICDIQVIGKNQTGRSYRNENVNTVLRKKYGKMNQNGEEIKQSTRNRKRWREICRAEAVTRLPQALTPNGKRQWIIKSKSQVSQLKDTKKYT